MDALTKTHARLARGLAIAAPVILLLLAIPLTLSAAFAAKVGLGSASATAIILAAFLSLYAHGDHSPRGELREFVSKAFTFAGAAPGFTLLVLSLAPVTVPIIEPLELGVPQPAEPTASPPSTVPWQLQVDTRIDAKIAAAFGQLRTAQAFPTETIVPLAVGCAVAVVIFVFTCWLADRAAKSKHVPPPAPPVTVEQMRAAIHRERRARRIESGAVWMLAVCIIATARRVRGR